MRAHLLLFAGALTLAACGADGDPSDLASSDVVPEASAGDAGDAASEEGPSDPVTELRVVGTDVLTFEPSTYTVPVGEEVTLTFAAEPGVEHDFNIAGADDVGSSSDERDGGHAHVDGMDDAHMDGTDDAHMDGMDDAHMDGTHGGEGDLHVAHPAAGEEVTETFTLTEAGTYEVYCSIPGHRQAGMVATLHVVD